MYKQLLSFFKYLYDLNDNQAKEIAHAVLDDYNVRLSNAEIDSNYGGELTEWQDENSEHYQLYFRDIQHQIYVIKIIFDIMISVSVSYLTTGSATLEVILNCIWSQSINSDVFAHLN